MAYSLTYEYIPDSSPYYKVTGYSNIATTDNVIIPDTYNDNIHGSYPVTHIKYNAFKECSDLTHITIGSNITYIDDYAFAWCDKLASITIPNGVTSVGSSVFYNCSSLTDVVFESNSQLAVISANMFQSCTSLKSLTIPSSVTSIDTGAFYDCSSLTNIVIPSSVGEIGEQAFYNCNSLINITVDESNPSYKSVNGSLYTKDGTMLIQYAAGQSVTTFSIPDGVTTIYPNAFLNCTSLVNVTIPDSVTDIYGGAFRNCTNLIQLILFPSTPPDLGSNAIPSNVQSIYVQQSSEAAYKVALNWTAFASKIVSDNIYLSFVRFNQKNKEYIDKKLTSALSELSGKLYKHSLRIITTDNIDMTLYFYSTSYQKFNITNISNSITNIVYSFLKVNTDYTENYGVGVIQECSYISSEGFIELYLIQEGTLKITTATTLTSYLVTEL